jgi:excisionase family DNA binding protein
MAEHPLDVTHAAAYLGISPAAFRALVHEAHIPHGIDGRRFTFTRSRLDAWLEAEARIQPGELAHLAEPLDGSGRYRRGGSAVPRTTAS